MACGSVVLKSRDDWYARTGGWFGRGAGSKLRLDPGRAISAVGRTPPPTCRPWSKARPASGCHGPRRVGHLIAPDQLVLGIRIHAFTWFLYPKKLLPCFFVQRASRSFWRIWPICWPKISVSVGPSPPRFRQHCCVAWGPARSWRQPYVRHAPCSL
jgi:hypothetical protein